MSEILERNGFVIARQKGSHRVLQRRVSDATVTVPVPLHNPVRRGTLLSIIRQSGLPKQLFEVENQAPVKN